MSEPVLMPEKLCAMFRYESETGNLYWRHRPAAHFTSKKQSAEIVAARWNSRLAGKAALGTKDSKGYLFGTINGKTYRRHRVVFAIINGRWPAGEIDHIDGDRQNNRACNLRDVTHRENGINAKMNSRNSTGKTGVRWMSDRKQFQAIITSHGRTYHLGHFKRFEDAAEARNIAERKFGFHPNHGRSMV